MSCVISKKIYVVSEMRSGETEIVERLWEDVQDFLDMWFPGEPVVRLFV